MSAVNQSSNTSKSIPRAPSCVPHLAAPGALGKAVNLWSPEVCGDWTVDCARGRAYADEVIASMRSTGNPGSLGHIVKSMISNGAYTGVEVGFLQRFGEAAISASA